MSDFDITAVSDRDHAQPKDAVREKIMGFADLPVGWEHGVGVPAAKQVVCKALRTLDIGRTLGLKADAFVGADGSISVVFYRRALSLETTVHVDNSLDVSLEDGIGLDFNEVAHAENASFQDVLKAILDLAGVNTWNWRGSSTPGITIETESDSRVLVSGTTGTVSLLLTSTASENVLENLVFAHT